MIPSRGEGKGGGGGVISDQFRGRREGGGERVFPVSDRHGFWGIERGRDGGGWGYT